MDMYKDLLKLICKRGMSRITNQDAALEVLSHAHIFRLDQEAVKNAIEGAPEKGLAEYAIQNGELLLPFDNVWLELNMFGKVIGFHVVKISSSVYGVGCYFFGEDLGLAYKSAIIFPKEAHNIKYMAGVNSSVCGRCRETNDDACFNRGKSEQFDMYSFDTLSEQLLSDFKRKLPYGEINRMFCGASNDKCKYWSPECTAYTVTMHGVVIPVVDVIGYINYPTHRVIRVEPVLDRNEEKSKRKGIKPYTWRRPHYILIDHDKVYTINSNAGEPGSGVKKAPHWRRAHFRNVVGRTGKDGNFIRYKESRQWVKQAWIGPEEWVFEQNKYKLVR